MAETNTAIEHTNIETLTAHERQLEILSIRRRMLKGEKLPEELIRRGLLLIRADRAARTGRKPASGGGSAGRGTRAAKPKPEGFDLSDF